MTETVSGTVLLVGKIAFLAALYGFVYMVFRSLMIEARRGGRPSVAKAAAAKALVDQWELWPGAAGPAITLQPPAPTVLTPPVPVLAPALPLPDPEPAPPEPPVEELAIELGPETAVGEVTGAVELISAEEPPLELPPPEPEAEVLLPEPVPVPAFLAAPLAERHSAALSVLTSPEAALSTGTHLELGDLARLGRADDSDIILRDRFVSSHHAEIVREGDAYVLRDLASTNGTFCNGLRVSRETPLHEGDRIGIGTTVFGFHQLR